MIEIKIIPNTEEKIGDSIIAFEVESPFPLPKEMRIGVDPGTTNLGIAIIRPEKQVVKLCKVTLRRHKQALNRLLDVQKVLGYAIGDFKPNSIAIIEGASYGAKYRQVELAEVRAAMVLWFHSRGIVPHIVPPKTIRKVSFGNGNVKNPWDNLDDDLAAALGAAYYEISR